MAQETAYKRMGVRFTSALAATTVPASSTEMLRIYVNEIDRIFVQLTVATAALTAFSIKAEATAAAADVTLYSTSGNFTSPAGLLVGTSGDLTILGVGAGWFVMDTKGLETVSIWATSAGTATLAIEVGGSS